MKIIKRFFKPTKLVINTSAKIKMSELISEYASDYINMGEDTEERQNYLNGACTAWNIAILDENHREGALRGAIDAYKKMNSENDDLENFEHDLRTLIEKKLKMFPGIKKVIVDAMIEPTSETKYRINIASAEDKESAKAILKMRKLKSLTDANKGPFTWLQPDGYWTGTEYAAADTVSWAFNFAQGSQLFPKALGDERQP